MKGIADTGFLVAFANRNDRDHDWVLRLASRINQANPRSHFRRSALR
jgi:predicted nucleic acid-binding protein